MAVHQNLHGVRCLFLVLLVVFGLQVFSQDAVLPPFGRDTVLVWKMETEETSSTFVVRIAEFLPERFIEWEDATTQGTIWMSSSAVNNSKTFLTARLFEGGVDTKGKDATTLWLSRYAFRELKSKQKVKLAIDSIATWMTLEGSHQLTVEINRAPKSLPVIKVKDERGSERWFLDTEDNPLLVKHQLRKFTQILTSITTDRPNTLRWIKGKRLHTPR